MNNSYLVVCKSLSITNVLLSSESVSPLGKNSTCKEAVGGQGGATGLLACLGALGAACTDTLAQQPGKGFSYRTMLIY
jgi:hypothetical protein